MTIIITVWRDVHRHFRMAIRCKKDELFKVILRFIVFYLKIEAVRCACKQKKHSAQAQNGENYVEQK